VPGKFITHSKMCPQASMQLPISSASPPPVVCPVLPGSTPVSLMPPVKPPPVDPPSAVPPEVGWTAVVLDPPVPLSLPWLSESVPLALSTHAAVTSTSESGAILRSIDEFKVMSAYLSNSAPAVAVFAPGPSSAAATERASAPGSA
jgi:hypothetical protein